ncbi:hypothetical protein OSTOST_02093 [Ostertagia ostertagi]
MEIHKLAEGEPNFFYGTQACLQMYDDGYWDDQDCDKKNDAFVCRRSI